MSKIFVLLIVLLTASSGYSFQPSDEEKAYQGMKYACTGVGESKEDPRWEKYPLKLMFTTGGRAYVSYVQVRITGQGGKLVFEADCDSPWLLVDLKPGKYIATIIAHKKYSQTVSIQILSGKQTSRAVRFSQITGDL